MVRVGGGAGSIEKFIATNQETELLKISNMTKGELESLGHDNQWLECQDSLCHDQF